MCYCYSLKYSDSDEEILLTTGASEALLAHVIEQLLKINPEPKKIEIYDENNNIKAEITRYNKQDSNS